MANRTVSVGLLLEAKQFKDEARKAAKETETLEDRLTEAARAGDKAGTSLDGAGKKFGGSGRAAKAAAKDYDEMRRQLATVDKQILLTEANLATLAKGYANTGKADLFKEIRRQKSQLSQLRNVRKLLPEPDMASAASWGQKLGDGIAAGVRGAPALGVAGGVIGAALAPTIGATIAGAIVGAAGVGGVIGGVTVAARHPAVKVAGMELGNFIAGDLETRAANFVPPVLAGIKRIRRGWQEMGPDLERVFNSSRFVEPLAEGAVRGAKAFVKGFADAVDEADPVIMALSGLVEEVGDATGDVFSMLADDAKAGAAGVNELSTAMGNLIRGTGQVVNGLAEFKGWMESADTRIDRFRYQIEDWGWSLDLTADGFKRGTKEAKALERASIGIGTAADFATIKAAGWTDAQIVAADYSGRYAKQLAQTTDMTKEAAAAGQAYKRAADGIADATDFATLKTAGLKDEQIAEIDVSGRYKKQTDQTAEATVKAAEAQNTAARAARGHRSALDELSKEMRAQADPVFGLLDAQQGLKKAQDEAAAATKKHGRNSDEAKEAHRKLGLAAIELQGRAGALGATFNGKLTPEMRATFKAAGLTKAQIKNLEGQFKTAKKEGDKFAKNYGVSVSVAGDQAALIKLRALNIMQNALKKGVSISTGAARSLAGDARAAKDRGVFHSGGYTGPGGKYDEAGIVHADEYVIRKESRQRIEREHPGALDTMNDSGRLPGYAAGGAVRWPYRTTAAMTRIPSRAEVERVVIPNAPYGATAPWMERMLEARFNAAMISGFRRGSRTLSGNLSYHASNRAVDFPPIRAMAAFMYQNYKSRLKEAITPWQEYNVHNGRSRRWSGAVWNQHNFAGGNAHNHFAMANGGVIREPVFGVGASGSTYSLGEGYRPEKVTPMYTTGGSAGAPPVTTVRFEFDRSPLGQLMARALRESPSAASAVRVIIGSAA